MAVRIRYCHDRKPVRLANEAMHFRVNKVGRREKPLIFHKRDTSPLSLGKIARHGAFQRCDGSDDVLFVRWLLLRACWDRFGSMALGAPAVAFGRARFAFALPNVRSQLREVGDGGLAVPFGTAEHAYTRASIALARAHVSTDFPPVASSAGAMRAVDHSLTNERSEIAIGRGSIVFTRAAVVCTRPAIAFLELS